MSACRAGGPQPLERLDGQREAGAMMILDPAAPIPYQPGARGVAGTYAATSLPTRREGRG